MDSYELRAQAMAALSPASVAVPSCESDRLQREVSALYEEYGGALLGYARGVARNPDLARDAVQEAFLRYYSQRRAGVVIEAPRAWLYKVVFNYLMNARAESSLPLEHAANSRDPGHSPQAQAEAASLEARLEKILSPREMTCVRLRAEGLSYEDISSVLGIRSGTVGAVLTRAVQKITKELRKG